jgi:hypothetical protein
MLAEPSPSLDHRPTRIVGFTGLGRNPGSATKPRPRPFGYFRRPPAPPSVLFPKAFGLMGWSRSATLLFGPGVYREEFPSDVRAASTGCFRMVNIGRCGYDPNRFLDGGSL